MIGKIILIIIALVTVGVALYHYGYIPDTLPIYFSDYVIAGAIGLIIITILLCYFLFKWFNN